jgi:sulfate adenylyltransferase subunit 2
MDVWQYIYHEGIELPSLYFAHEREIFKRDGVILAATEVIERRPEEQVEKQIVRFRTIGDMTCTGATDSKADTLEAIIQEVAASRVTERGGRADDKRSESAMEDRKKEGYF